MDQPSFPGIHELFGAAFEADDPNLHAKTHERGHVETIQGALQALSLADLTGMLTGFNPNVEMEIHCPDFFPFVRRARGVEEVKRAVAHNFSVVEDQTPTYLNVVAQGDIIDAVLRET